MKCFLCGKSDLDLLTDMVREGPSNVFHCPECDLGMLDQEPTDLQSFYDNEYRKKYGPAIDRPSDYAEIFESYVNYQGNRLRILGPWLTPDARVLEVGCSTGHFLANIKERVAEAVGVDYDSGAAAYGAKRCGITTFGGGLEQSGLEEGSFDVVCAMQTLEHVPDPVGFVRLLARYVRPGGLLYIEVPNLRDPLLSVYGEPTYGSFYYHRAHLFYFGERALRAVMERAGVPGTIRYFQDYNLTNHLHWAHTSRPQPNCHLGLGRPALPLMDDNLQPTAAADLQAWLERADREYKDILARHGLTDNLACLSIVGGDADDAMTDESRTSSARPLPANPQLVVFDFDGVMTDNRVWVDQDGRELVSAHRGDGWGIARLKDRGIDMMILSTETNRVVAARAAKLGLPVIHGVGDKRAVLAAELQRRGVDPAQTIFVGNDVNDVVCFDLVGCAVVVADAHPDIMRVADVVLTRRGGDGAVRELCDRLLR